MINLFGVLKNEILIPEVALIKDNGTSVGKFEITNAQFKLHLKELVTSRAGGLSSHHPFRMRHENSQQVF